MQEKSRINCIYYFFCFLFLILIVKIAYLQIFRVNFFQNLAEEQHYRLLPLEGKRGYIFDCKGRVLSQGIDSFSVYADPHFIKSPDITARSLATLLGIPAKELQGKLKMKKRFVWLKRKISWKDKEQINSLKLKGIGFIREQKRFYSQGELASSVLGIVDIDNNGLEGIELVYDHYLKGKKGSVKVLQDSFCREVLLTPQIVDPQDGLDLILTIDAHIQYWAETYLEETVKNFYAKGGSVVIMDAVTGEIIALANYPVFDYNNENRATSFRKNSAVTDVFEPGSVFKIVTLLSAIHENKFSDNDKIFCENGMYKIPGTILHDWKPNGTLSFKEVFKKSSNIGTTKIAQTVGAASLYNYIKKFGFGEKTGIDFPGETKGMVKPLIIWSKTSRYIIPIGQEIGVNMIQLVRAFAVIANGGYLVKPHITKAVRGRYYSRETVINSENVFKESSIKRAQNILMEVVEEGSGRGAAILGRKIGGKTGTAQKYDYNIKRYAPNKYRSSFVGFILDASNPIVIGVTIDEPEKSHLGGVVAAPLFKKIAEKVILYFDKEKLLANQ